MGLGHFRPRRREPIRSSAFQALSITAFACEILRCIDGQGCAKTRMALIPGATGNFVSTLSRAGGMPPLRLLHLLRLRMGREVQYAGQRNPDGRSNRTL